MTDQTVVPADTDEARPPLPEGMRWLSEDEEQRRHQILDRFGVHEMGER